MRRFVLSHGLGRVRAALVYTDGRTRRGCHAGEPRRQPALFSLSTEQKQWLDQIRAADNPEGSAKASFHNGTMALTYLGRLRPGEILLRLTLNTPPPSPPSLRNELGLTGREAEVLSWLSRGKTNRDIAQILGLSPRTIDKHLEQIYAKLGVENRTSAAAVAARVLNKKDEA